MPEDSKFCPKCGEKAAPIKVSQVESSIFDDIKNHLEFLGYTIEIEKAKKDGEKSLLIAMHERKHNILFFNLNQNMLMMRISLKTKKKWNNKMVDFTNSSNKVLICTKVFCELEDGLVNLEFESIYTGAYIKEIFGNWLDLIEKDIDVLFRSGEGFDELFID
ncbi:MAG: hypothetical protein M0Q94_06555 [Candidatus Cloacimonetes bacterium]|nr:hypothetical protein [Candidatus Cloacimonadota bacterium]